MENLITLCDSINELCKSLDEDYNINNGGCCFVAFLISQYLDDLGIKYRLIIYDSCDKDLDRIKHEIIDNSCNHSLESSVTGDYTCNHYCLIINGAKEINSSCFSELDDSYYRYDIGDVTSFDIEWLYEHGDWNYDYNTDNNRIIRKLIKSFFNEISANQVMQMS